MQTMEMTGMEIGGVTAFGLSADLPLWVDGDVMRRDFIILGGGKQSSKLKVLPSLLETTPNVEFVEGLAKPTE